MWSDPQGVDYYRPAMNPQSFGADAPPTGGYDKSDLLTEVLTHPTHLMRHPRGCSDMSDKATPQKGAFAYPIYPMKSGAHYQKSSIFLVKLKYITYLCSEIVYRIDTLRMLK